MAESLIQVPDGFVTNFSRAVASALKQQIGLPLAHIDADILAGTLESTLRDLFPQISLSTVRPDFESIIAQLMSVVEQEAPWTDVDILATGQMLLRMVSAVGAMNQFAIARANQEAFHFTAFSDTSIMVSARDLGNRLRRSRSAYANVTLSRGDDRTYVVLPAYTEFQASNGDNIFTMFNRESVVFGDTDITASTTLYEGSIHTSTVVSTGVPFQTVEFGNENRRVSDDDLQVTVAGVVWAKADQPLWHYGPTDKVFLEATLPNGDVEILFGDGKYGAAPPAGVPIVIRWIETSGANGNMASTNIVIVIKQATTGLGSIRGALTTAIQNGSDALSASYYRLFASSRAAARGRAVSRPDYPAMVIGEYPGVYDARFQGQAEVAPRRPSMMNIVHTTLLTDPVFTDQQWNDFVDYMRSIDIYKTVLVRRDPTPIIWNVSATVYCDAAANLAVIGQKVAASVRNAFNPAKRLINAPRNTSASSLTLGYSWYLSDLSDLLKLKGTQDEALIQYVIPGDGMVDQVCPDVFHYIKLGTLSLDFAYTKRGGYAGRKDAISHTLFYDANGLLVVD